MKAEVRAIFTRQDKPSAVYDTQRLRERERTSPLSEPSEGTSPNSILYFTVDIQDARKQISDILTCPAHEDFLL